MKGRVLEAALLGARGGAGGAVRRHRRGARVYCGLKFVLYRESEKLRRARNQVGRAKLAPSLWPSPTRCAKGAQARRRAAQAERERRNAYFRQTAIDRAIQPGEGKGHGPGTAIKERMR